MGIVGREESQYMGYRERTGIKMGDEEGDKKERRCEDRGEM